MRKILLLSDTHGYIDEAICRHASEADEIWHAGDIGSIKVYDTLAGIKPVKAVYGNIDGREVRAVSPENEIFTCEKKKVWITHIGGYPPNYNPALKKLLQEIRPDIFICGHSHILKVMFDKNLNLLHINPGAAGTHGFHIMRTMVRFVIDGEDIKNMDVIELGKRTEV
jgi:putative phosphoesterase